MKQPDRRIGGWAVSVVILTVYPPNRLTAQDTTRAPIVTTGAIVVAPDTAHRIKPFNAFWRSLLLPGWGQAETGRPVTGALFAAWEGVTAMMTLKAQSEVHYLREAGSTNVGAKRQEVQDWLVLWIFNHFFSGAEAFVSAHLQDFPKDLKVQAFPRGVGVTVTVP